MLFIYHSLLIATVCKRTITCMALLYRRFGRCCCLCYYDPGSKLVCFFITISVKLNQRHKPGSIRLAKLLCLKELFQALRLALLRFQKLCRLFEETAEKRNKIMVKREDTQTKIFKKKMCYYNQV